MTKRRSKTSTPSLSPRSKAIHGSFSSRAWEFSHHLVPPMTASTTFRLESLKRGAEGFSSFGQKRTKNSPIWIYDRLEEPTTLLLEEQLASMEGGECAVSFGSGMGAIASTFLTLLLAGERVIAHKTLYGCTYSLLTEWLPRYGLKSSLIDVNGDELDVLLEDPTSRVVYFESVSNPNLEIIDLQKLVKRVKAANRKRKRPVIVVVDNTFATPWSLRPLDWGVDIVIQSLTKNIAGFGTEMGGAVITREEFDVPLRLARKDFGAIIHPSSAWHILTFGISSQALRFEQQQKSALKIARFLEKHPKVESVVYPGLSSHPQHALAKKLLRSPEGDFCPGTMIAFTLKGNMKKCERFVDDIARNSYTITLAVSLGLTKTLIEVPGYMTHSAIPEGKREHSGIDPRMIRLSIGIENVKDLITDLETSLKKI